MMRALIGSNGRVIDVRRKGEEFPAPNDWVDAPDQVEIGWLYDTESGVVTAPAVPDLPAGPARLSPKAFRGLFTEAEQSAIAAASLKSAAVQLLLFKLSTSDTIGLGDSKIAAGLDALEGAGLISAKRKAAILAGKAPT